MRIYKIHPAIGIARVGMSEDGYFLSPEKKGEKPIEMTDQGEEASFKGYKDAAWLVRRQGARFRIFEYERDAVSGKDTIVREITGSDARIEWRVQLASRKAAGPLMGYNVFDDDGAELVVPTTSLRNTAPPGFTHADLAAEVALEVEGANYKPSQPPMGSILGKPFYIGEARTDAEGRLIILGGRGKSDCWGTPAPTLSDFLNNAGWYDDIADGPIDAKVMLNGASEAVDAVGAWVITAPPDFAPDVTPITTLFDIAVHAYRGEAQTVVSYSLDIEPILKRAAGYASVNAAAGGVWWAAMREFLEAPEKLKDNSASALQHRRDVRDAMLEGQSALVDFRMTKRQRRLLERWAEGDFIPGEDATRPQANEAEALDEVALTKCVGGGFFPGIEAGLLLRNSTIYSEQCRLTRGIFTDYGNVTAQLRSGSLTERMACPWQADFVQCVGAWWPAQRPDFAEFTDTGVEQRLEWDRGVRVGSGGNHASRKGMVDHFAQLGVIESLNVGGKIVQSEKGRDPALDTGT